MKKVLLVGLSVNNARFPNVEIETLGLCRPEVCEDKASYALYEYDLIIINPESYSHFIFGHETEQSKSPNELSELKMSNNYYDLDTVFDHNDRSEELKAAMKEGAAVIWLLSDEKREQFFGWRKNFIGYCSNTVESIVNRNEIYRKKSQRLAIQEPDHQLAIYFNQLKIDGWSHSIDPPPGIYKSLATTPEGYDLGIEVQIEQSVGWLVTPPKTEESTVALISAGLGLEPRDVSNTKYDGVFLSHTSDDKPFVRKLKEDLESHGVQDVWLDEAEIQIGDSLIEKIQEGLKKTKYIAVILSPKSINSNWVKKELEIAMTREISSGEVVVLPIVYESCDMPEFLEGKLYADCTNEQNYEESLKKLLRRLRREK